MNNPNEKNAVLDVSSAPQQKKPAGWIGVVFAVTLVVAIVLTALTTFSFTVNTFLPEPEEKLTDIEILSGLMEEYAYFTPEYEEMSIAALKAFIASSGDNYTAYYTDEEYAEIRAEQEGRYVGIGVTVLEDKITYEEKEITVLKIVRISKNSPAMESSLSVGDYIYSINAGDGAQLVNDIGREAAQRLIRGESGSTVTISYLTKTENGYDLLQAGLIRAAVETVSVEGRISELDPSVGIIRIYQFDLTTPTQLCSAMDSLIGDGIQKFVFDLRDNRGGDLRSIEACASYFVKNGDVILTKEGKHGNETVFAGYRNYTDEYASCSVLTEDIGQYRNYDFVTLVNGNTASAAELFTAVLRDYELAEVVGVQTYGKGSMQKYMELSPYGMKGVLKLTTHLYYPPCGQGYHGVGIVPDLIVPLGEGLEINEIDEWDDNQLLCAIGLLLPPIE